MAPVQLTADYQPSSSRMTVCRKDGTCRSHESFVTHSSPLLATTCSCRLQLGYKASMTASQLLSENSTGNVWSELGGSVPSGWLVICWLGLGFAEGLLLLLLQKHAYDMYVEANMTDNVLLLYVYMYVANDIPRRRYQVKRNTTMKARCMVGTYMYFIIKVRPCESGLSCELGCVGMGGRAGIDRRQLSSNNRFDWELLELGPPRIINTITTTLPTKSRLANSTKTS